MINIGIVGCGNISNKYFEVFEKIKEAKIIAACDINQKKLKNLEKKYQIKSYSNIDNFIRNSKIDLAIISSFSGLHYTHTKKCLENNIHTLTEKPIALRLDHANKLIKLSNSKSLMAGVVFQNRYNKSIKYLKEEIDKKSFGKKVLCTARIRWCRDQKYYSTKWRGTWKMDGGVISQQAIHHIDILQLIGGKIKNVSTFATKRLNKLEADDTSVSILKFEDGSLGALEATTSARPIDLEASFSIIAEKGMCEIGGIALNKIEKLIIKGKSKKNLAHIIKTNSEKVKNGMGNGHLPLIKETIKRLKSKNLNPPISIFEATKSLRVVHAIYSSSEKNRVLDFGKMHKSKKLGI